MVNNIELVTGIIANISVVVGVVIAIMQLYKMRISNEQQKQTFIADHERRKKQSTIEFYNEINKETVTMRSLISDKSQSGIISIDVIEGDAKLVTSIKRYLSLMERFSVGVNTNVYDIGVFDRVSGAATVKTYYKLREYILNARKKAPYIYTDFELMVQEIEGIRKKRFPTQSDYDISTIKHS